MTTRVSFELAAQLIGKGMPIHHTVYFDDKSLVIHNYPTIAEVVMWVYEKHKIWIWVERYSTLFKPYAEEIGDERFGKWEGFKYSTIEEAYTAAIESSLEEII